MAETIPVRPADGLANVATGQGIQGRDKLTSAFWSMARLITAPEIEAAYRSSWLVRKVHDVIPTEMTKNWRTWNLKGAEADKIADEERRLGVRESVREALRLGRLRGGAAIIMGLPGNASEPAPKTVQPGGLRYLWTTTRDYLSVPEMDRDLNSPGFGKPKRFTLSTSGGQQDIHPSRVLVFPGLPSAGFLHRTLEDEVWGFPLLEALNEAIQNAETAMGGVAAMIPEALVDIISIPGLTEMVSTSDGEAALAKRLQVAKLMRSMFQAAVMDGGDGTEGSGEDWETRQLSFQGLPEVIRTFLQIVAGAVDMPLTRLIGAPPEGMNATGEHDERNFLAMVKGRQDNELRPKLESLDTFLLGSAGVRDAKASFAFAPLAEVTPQEQAELDNLTADTFDIIKSTGLIQHDALAKTMVAVLNDRPTFPGLADNVAASPEKTLPAEKELENASTVAEARAVPAGVAAKPGGSAARAQRRQGRTSARDAASGLVDATLNLRTFTDAASGEVLTLRPVSLAEVRDATPRTLYVSRRLLNPQEFLNHWRGQGVENLMAAGDLHVTVIAALNAVDWMDLPADWSSDEKGRLIVPPGGPRVVSHLGDYDVLEFASSDLKWRFERLVDRGVEPRWPDFKPHVSFRESGNPLDAAEVEKLKPYTGRLVFGPEIFETLA